MKKKPKDGSTLAARVQDFVREGFTPHYGKAQPSSASSSIWARLKALRTELWLDTGDMDAIGKLWTKEFSALTTNNTLLNKEVQKGTYDTFIAEAARLLDDFPTLDARDRRLELAFMLNARHGLKLVEAFDAHVSVEEHTDLAHDLDGAVRYARRFHAICPERFYVKLPFTPAGLLAVRRLSKESIPVNFTLGFSARQNYVAIRLGRPEFVNVFLGRLNSFVADNGLGSGDYVGERATLASQAVVRSLRERMGVRTRQIGASFRGGKQVNDLAGIDVMTLPPKAAEEFLALPLREEALWDRSREDYEPAVNGGLDRFGLNTLWDVDERVTTCLDRLEQEDLEVFSPADLVAFFAENGCEDLLVDWTDDQIGINRAEGKIPKLSNWSTLLDQARIGLDSLMNLAGLNSFIADQAEMDRHVETVLALR